MPSAAEAAPATSSSKDLPAEFTVDVDGEVFNVKVSSTLGKVIGAEGPKKPEQMPDGAVVSPMQGMILAVLVAVGDKVEEEDVLMTIEAMKMQNQIKATHAGEVKEIFTFQGEVVNSGDLLMVVGSNDK
jgi:pyruvate carboxylase subunit B